MCICTVFVNAQIATNLPADTKEICTQKTAISSTKSINPQTPPKKSLIVTKQRRLKSYQSNHKIARKRKATVVKNMLSVNE